MKIIATFLITLLFTSTVMVMVMVEDVERVPLQVNAVTWTTVLGQSTATSAFRQKR